MVFYGIYNINTISYKLQPEKITSDKIWIRNRSPQRNRPARLKLFSAARKKFYSLQQAVYAEQSMLFFAQKFKKFFTNRCLILKSDLYQPSDYPCLVFVGTASMNETEIAACASEKGTPFRCMPYTV